MGRIGPGRAFCSLGQAGPVYVCTSMGRAEVLAGWAGHFRPVQGTGGDMQCWKH